MNKLLFLALFALSGLAISCKEDAELRKSVFIPDEEKPGLPKYSEWGYNTFGAYYDRTPFTSDETDAPAKIIVQNKVTTLELFGYKAGQPLVITISIPEFDPKGYDELVELHDRTIDLTEEDVVVNVSGSFGETEVLEGMIHFQRAQLLLVDRSPYQSILSGTFAMKIRVGETAVSISDGRFDLGISESAFFRY